jgi:hypothetical protein
MGVSIIEIMSGIIWVIIGIESMKSGNIMIPHAG